MSEQDRTYQKEIIQQQLEESSSYSPEEVAVVCAALAAMTDSEFAQFYEIFSGQTELDAANLLASQSNE